jgi:hypothetical protein
LITGPVGTLNLSALPMTPGLLQLNELDSKDLRGVSSAAFSAEADSTALEIMRAVRKC